MRHFSLLFVSMCSAAAIGWALAPAPTRAQPPGAEDEAAEDEAAEDEAAEDEAAEDEAEEGEPTLRPPTLEAFDPSGFEGQGEEAEAEGEEAEGEEAEQGSDPGDDASMLEGMLPSEGDPSTTHWVAPQTALTLHGYMRARYEYQDNFFLGRTDILPFSRFVPADRGALPAGGCGDAVVGAPTVDDGACDSGSESLGFVNMRLRLRPTLSLSDDVRVHMLLDVLDNAVFGSAPSGSFSATTGAPSSFRGTVRDSINVRRAWAEVSNRGLGQISFGRMGFHWGLGMLSNAGNGIDDDYSTDVDRLMAVTKLLGFHWFVARDFADEGFVLEDPSDMASIPFDLTQEDDIDQWVFGVAHRLSPEAQSERLQRGEWVLNGGLYFLMRSQHLSSDGLTDPSAGASSLPGALIRRDADLYVPDVWGQFLWKGLRVELEGALVAGTLRNIESTFFDDQDYTLLQGGLALESELRLLDDRLALRFYAGFASGDSDVDGLSASDPLLAQTTSDDQISTFAFHRNYRIDLILWRTVMQRVAGAWYLRPGIGYDLIRNSFGRLLGARVDMVYSRASQEVQTYGSDPNLGLEVDFTAYYRSEDGPGPTDGFYAQFQYGILFPFSGLGTVTGFEPTNAQTLRLILGVEY